MRCSVAMLLLLVLPCGCGSDSPAATAGLPADSPSDTAGPPADLQGHTATLLLTGKVLVAGGHQKISHQNGPPLTTANLYDPATGSWSGTGPLGTARAYHTATLLSSGKVLVVNGTTAELYDPEKRAWRATGSPSRLRTLHTATLLRSGKVLVAGCLGLTDPAIAAAASAELYDPATETWEPTGSLHQGRGYHAATLLPDGRVLVAGGRGVPDRALYAIPTVELYDPVTGSWTETGSLRTGRLGHWATTLPNGRALVVGGSSGAEGFASYSFTTGLLESYDPANGTWSDAGMLVVSRDSFGAVQLKSGSVFVVGGINGKYPGADEFDTVATESYDYQNATSTRLVNMTARRSYHTATLLPSGEILVVGGNHTGGPATELYDADTATWR